MWRHARRAAHTVTLLLYCCPLLAVRWMRGACADHLFNALTTRCAFVGFFNMCVLYTLCMRSVCALYTRSALAARCAFVVNSLASPKSWQKLGAQRRTDLIFHFLIDFQCAGRASRMCDWAIRSVLHALSEKYLLILIFTNVNAAPKILCDLKSHCWYAVNRKTSH